VISPLKLGLAEALAERASTARRIDRGVDGRMQGIRLQSASGGFAKALDTTDAARPVVS